MLHSFSVVHRGSQFKEGFSGFFTDSNFFIVLSIEEGITPENGASLFETFKSEFAAKQITSLNEFDTELSALIVKLNFPAHFSLATGYIYNDVLYVKTVGKGQVYFRRGKDFDLLMSGDKSASGYVQEYDMVVFTTTKINELLGQTHDIKVFVDLDPPEDIVEKLRNENYEEAEEGFIGVFTEFTSQIQQPLEQPSVPADTQEEAIIGPVITPSSPPEVVISPVSSPNPVVVPSAVVSPPPPQIQTQSPPAPVSTPAVEMNLSPSTTPGFSSKNKFSIMPFFALIRSKKIAFVIVAILFVILLWSVVFGYQRRASAQLQEKIEGATQEIDAKLKEAEDEAFIDPDSAKALIAETKNIYTDLETSLNGQKTEELAKLQSHIAQSESRIFKREEKPYTEFYDLGLENEKAQGTKVYREGALLAILDIIHKKVYLLDLDKKSLIQYTDPQLADATDVALYNEEVFFFSPTKGVFKFTAENKARVMIKTDSKWKQIDDIEIFNGNIYLLDSEGSDIYKYLVTESGYSERSSYFTGDKPSSIEKGADLTIDSAIYIASGDVVLKYLRGLPDPFDTIYPEKTPTLSGLYTTEDIEQMYVWDAKGGAVYVLGKDGEYMRQIASSIIGKAKDIFVYEDNVYVFDGKKLYSIPTD